MKKTVTKVMKYQKRYRRKRYIRGRPRIGIGRNVIFNFKRTTYPAIANVDTLLGGLNGESLTFSSDMITLNTGSNGTSGVTYYSLAHTFTLDELPDYTEYTTLFDQYRIMGIGIRIVGFANDATNANVKCVVHAAPDVNDGTALAAAGSTGVQLLRSKIGYKCRNVLSQKPFKTYTKAKLTTEVAGVGGTRYITPQGKPWSSSAYPDVKYYGYKTIFEVVTPSSATEYFVQLKYELVYYLQCKDPR